MITIQGKLPRQLCLAVSGGVDSVAALHFLSRNHNVTIVHINHNEGNSDTAAAFVEALADKYQCPLIYKRITVTKPTNRSLEEFWRNQRYELFHLIPQPVITAHTLDDCIETWIWSSLHGTGKIIPYTNQNVVRPFRLTPKREFVNWARRNNLSWVEDSSNENLSLTRNYIRHEMMPCVLRVNPGIATTITKKVKLDYVG
jgi:tRNA(Ile)-lysidine synthase